MKNKPYQPNYKPSMYSASEQEDLRMAIGRGGGNFETAINEVKRVAKNIVAALENEETPDAVKEHIKHYVRDLVRFDFMEYSQILIASYVIACRRISQIPFVPDKNYIEALTGDDKENAIQTAKQKEKNEDFVLFKSISEADAKKLAENIILSKDVKTDIPLTLAALVYAVGNEPHPIDRADMVNSVLAYCFLETMYYGKEHFAFVRKAANFNSKK